MLSTDTVALFVVITPTVERKIINLIILRKTLPSPARAAWLLLLSGVTKVNKNTLSSTLLRDHKIVVRVGEMDFLKLHFLLTSSAIGHLILIDNFKALLLKVTVAK